MPTSTLCLPHAVEISIERTKELLADWASASKNSVRIIAREHAALEAASISKR